MSVIFRNNAMKTICSICLLSLTFALSAVQAADVFERAEQTMEPFNNEAEELAASVEKGVGRGMDATSSGIQKGIGAVDDALDGFLEPVDRKLKEWDE